MRKMYSFSEAVPGVCHRTFLTAIVLAAPAILLSQPAESVPGTPAPRALVDQYCVACHNQKVKTAGVSFDGVDWANAGASAEILEKALRKVRTGEMPPAGMPHPPAALAASFTNWLQENLD